MAMADLERTIANAKRLLNPPACQAYRAGRTALKHDPPAAPFAESNQREAALVEREVEMAKREAGMMERETQLATREAEMTPFAGQF